MTFHLHLGAHKTASTHIQATLKKHRQGLAADGVMYHAPEDVQTLIRSGGHASAQMRALPSLRRAVASRRLLRLDTDVDRIVASHENSLGLCTEIFRARQLYPTAYRRLMIWRRLAERRPITIYLAIRNYAPFFSGAYIQAIRNAAFFEPDTAEKTDLITLPRRWPDVVKDIGKALPGARLIVWRYEDYPEISSSVLKSMTGQTPTPVQRRPMATPSQIAFQTLRESAVRTGTITNVDLDQVIKKHPITDDAQRFSLWSMEETALLTARYSEDVNQLHYDLGEDFLHR